MTTGGHDVTRLVGIAQQWLNEASEGAHGGLSTGAPECGVCPLCTLIAALRTADPAVVETVVDVAGTALVTVTDVLREAGDRLLATAAAAAASSASSAPTSPAPTAGPPTAAPDADVADAMTGEEAVG